MEKNTNKGWWWAFGIVVVIIIIVLLVRNHRAATNTPLGDSTAVTDDSALVSTEDLSAGSADLPVAGTAALPAPMSYQDALTKYANARIQFTPTCQATPSQATWKTGTNIMLDNRSANMRTVHLGSLGDITIKPWGFKIVRFTSAMLPNVITIDCDASQNVAQITIQA